MAERKRWWAARSDNVTGNYHVGYGDRAVIVVAEETVEESRALAIKIKDFLGREEVNPDYVSNTPRPDRFGRRLATIDEAKKGKKEN